MIVSELSSRVVFFMAGMAKKDIKDFFLNKRGAIPYSVIIRGGDLHVIDAISRASDWSGKDLTVTFIISVNVDLGKVKSVRYATQWELSLGIQFNANELLAKTSNKLETRINFGNLKMITRPTTGKVRDLSEWIDAKDLQVEYKEGATRNIIKQKDKEAHNIIDFCVHFSISPNTLNRSIFNLGMIPYSKTELNSKLEEIDKTPAVPLLACLQGDSSHGEQRWQDQQW